MSASTNGTLDEPGDEPGNEPVNAPGNEPVNAPGNEPVNAPGSEPVNEPGSEPVNAPEYRRRQRKSANLMGLILGAFALLFFLIAVAKMSFSS